MKHRFFTILFFVAISTYKITAQYEVQFSNGYPPYNYLNEQGELVGFNVDILNAIKDLYGEDITINSGDWNTINKALNTNVIDAIGGVHFPGSPDSNFDYSRSAINTSHCFFYNSNYLNKFSLEYLRSAKKPLVALWKNDVLVHYIQSINPSVEFLYVRNYEDLIKTLDREDVTCIFGQRVGGMYYAKKLNKNYIRPLEHRILERSMGFKVSKNSPKLAEILNNGLEVILANGEYQKIYDTWIAEYDKNPNDWRNYVKYFLLAGVVILSLFVLLLITNRILQLRVNTKTKDLRNQLALNSQIMKELENQKNKAEESDKMKSAFLANMSHEIRTPMNGILGFTDLLKTVEYSSEKQAKFIDIIQQSGNRMLETINNIIDVSKLESGLEKTNFKEVNIHSIISELYNFFAQEASLKGIKFTVKKVKTTFTKSFYTDEAKLNSILTNLIKNALKFTTKGSIEIKYVITNEVAEFWIKDTGIGIPQKKQAIIFKEFVQADYSHSSGFEGSGLGLSISKGYVQLLNGKIQLESEPDKGSTFYVKIPNKNSRILVSDKTLAPTLSDIPFSTKFKIIIAEDDETSYYYLKYLLAPISERIVHAKDGIEAVELAKKYSDTTIILMDIKMPNQNGFRATKRIRKFNKNVYIIAQSAYVQESFKLKAQQAGCNTFISKPINQEKLFEIFTRIPKN